MSHDPFAPQNPPPATEEPPPLPPGWPAPPADGFAAPPPGYPPPGGAYVPPYLMYSSATIFPYLSARPRARVLVRWLWALLALQVVMLWPAVEDLFQVSRAQGSDEAAAVVMDDDSDFRSLKGVIFVAVPFAQLVCLVNRVVYWMMWVHRTYRNLRPLGAEGLSTTPGWAVGYNFIPIVNLFRPFTIMLETWRASDPRHAGGTGWQALPPSRLVMAWWVMYLVSVLVIVTTVVAAASAEHSGNGGAYVAIAWVNVFLTAFNAVIYLVEVYIVQSLTDLQETRANATDGVPFAAQAGGRAPQMFPEPTVATGDPPPVP
jgi:hypothetical protein